MIYGYARVSTVAQDLTSQLAQLKAAGFQKVFREKTMATFGVSARVERRQSVARSDNVGQSTTSRRGPLQAAHG